MEELLNLYVIVEKVLLVAEKISELDELRERHWSGTRNGEEILLLLRDGFDRLTHRIEELVRDIIEILIHPADDLPDRVGLDCSNTRKKLFRLPLFSRAFVPEQAPEKRGEEGRSILESHRLRVNIS
jgi:hypothetical protein